MMNEHISKAEVVVALFSRYLEDYSHESLENLPSFYTQVKDMNITKECTLLLDPDHFTANLGNGDVVRLIFEEFYAFQPYLNQAATDYVSRIAAQVIQDKPRSSVTVSFLPLREKLIFNIREMIATRIGQLSSLSATVTRTSEVRPELIFGTFECQSCMSLSEGVEQDFKFTPPTRCNNTSCPLSAAGGRGNFVLLPKLSTFDDWQKVRVQEAPSDIPVGNMPRSMNIILRGDAVEKCKPGDSYVFTGCLIAVPDVASLATIGEKIPKQKGKRRTNDEGISGLKGLGNSREMSYSLAFLASSVAIVSPTGNILMAEPNEKRRVHDQLQWSEAQLSQLKEISQKANLIELLRNSFAPNIFGHDDVKLGILLMLIGGVHKKTQSGSSLRGDINVCLVGDPSTAKSQFLKYVCSLIPRSVYTSGKASSAAGLTATVARDPDSGEFCIEAGALMLADNGVCCIDEFDKMDDIDQVAIHEAMEQQTISITKAGIQATLNARTSVLAAANPIYGRYNRSRSLKANLNMSAAIMSRFDLFFTVLDEPNRKNDSRIASHLVNAHLEGLLDSLNLEQKSQSRADILTTKQLERYITFAKTIDPILTPDVQVLLVDYYNQLRGSTGDRAFQVTVRQLESLIRLSEAMARMHLDMKVRLPHVEWAFRLLQKSIVTADDSEVELEEETPETDENNQNGPNMGTGSALNERLLGSQLPKAVYISQKEYAWLRSSVLEMFKTIHDDNRYFILKEDLLVRLLTLSQNNPNYSHITRKIINLTLNKLLKETMLHQEADEAGEIMISLKPKFWI